AARAIAPRCGKFSRPYLPSCDEQSMLIDFPGGCRFRRGSSRISQQTIQPWVNMTPGCIGTDRCRGHVISWHGLRDPSQSETSMNLIKHIRLTLCAGALVAALPLAVSAQIKVGVTVSATGPAASLGIPERDTVALLPTEIGGQAVQYIVLDD